MKNKEKEVFNQNLQEFGLTAEEAIVYLTLLERGRNGDMVGRLKNDLQIARTTLYGILEKLREKGWIEIVEIRKQPRRMKFIAKAPLEVLNKTVENLELKVKTLKEKRLYIGDNLDKLYQEKKELTIDTIHPGSQKYIKPLFAKKWKVKSEVIETSESLARIVYDYELIGYKERFTQECGLIIFEYNYSRNIENDDNLIRANLNLLKSKTEYEIRNKAKNNEIPDFEDVKLEDTELDGFLGAFVYIKFKEGSIVRNLTKEEWVLIGKEAAIPTKNKIFLIHGEDKNFQFLEDTIINTENFHHLI
ncbi:MAG: helix-turn-helix domain-containing protein [Promethearchaeota archaeon]